MTEAAGNLFGFLNDDNRSRWKGLLQNFLKGVSVAFNQPCRTVLTLSCRVNRGMVTLGG